MSVQLRLKSVWGSITKCFGRHKTNAAQNPGRQLPISLAKSNTKFNGNNLCWPVERKSNTYRIFVVEPRLYSPQSHAEIFNAALDRLVRPDIERVSPFEKQGAIPSFSSHDPFDLVTFPEAFLPKDDLLSILKNTTFPWLGCVHVGVRPTGNEDQHLFSTKELKLLLEDICNIPDVEKDDLGAFTDWLNVQADGDMFNVGCLFMLDAANKFRVCLHPKLVRSKYEMSALAEEHMTEANLLTLVTLLPSDKTLLSITLQPLLCSDALQLNTDRPNSRPLEAVNTDANCFGDSPPDHIDIISVATCTPHVEQTEADETYQLMWHQQFRDSFRRIASDPALVRHHFATFVLSNFQQLSDGKKAGLSGAFLPIPLPKNFSPPTYISLTAWGKNPRDGDNTWVRGSPLFDKEFLSLGYLTSLNSPVANDMADARMMGFVVSHLPRHSLLKRETSLVDFKLLVANRNLESNSLAFIEKKHD